MWHYLSTKDEIQEGAIKLFEKVKLGKVKVEIFKKYKLEDAIQAHKDLEGRKIIGPAIIIP
jgi:NADPH2:quinone reductase